jgi:MFS family permease
MKTVREPVRLGKMRIADASGDATEEVSLRVALGFLATRWKTYLGLALTVSGSTILGYGFLSWLTAMYMRTWDWSVPQISLGLGVVLLIAGPIGVNGAGWLADRWFKQGRKDAHLKIMMYSGPLMLVSSVLMPLMPSPQLALLLFAPHILGAAGITAAGGAALMLVTPNQLRAQTVAIYYFIISLAGLTLGPTSVALLTDYVFRDESALRYSLAIIGLLAPLLSVVCAVLTLRPYQRSIAEAETWGD